MNLKEQYVTTEEGVELFVQKLGQGPQAILIPNGFYLFDALESLANGYTLIFYDPRNRGRSNPISDQSKLKKGINHDVDDIEALRRHFSIYKVSLIGHSYMGVTVALYAMRHPEHTARIVQIGSMAPDPAKTYPAHLTNLDGTLAEVMAKLAQLQKERPSQDAKQFCRKFWSILCEIYVANPAAARKLNWDPCDLPNEINFPKQWNALVLPSLQNLNLTPQDFAKAQSPILAIHGRKDRSSPYGASRDWAQSLPNARLLTLDEAAHVPWIEYPDQFRSALETFLNGEWPVASEKVGSLDNQSG
jgi:proline iminopeptidase